MATNPYAQFSADGDACSILRPDTPTPWTNVISNRHYGVVVSNTGAGFAFLDNSQLNVISRWDMDLIRDDRGRFLYATDLDTRQTWSLSPSPCRTIFDHYECVHRPGATTFKTTFNEIEAVWTLAVAPDDPVEIWQVTLKNTASRARRLRIASSFEWCCGSAPDVKREFHKLFITTEHDARRHAILATKNMWDVPARTPAEHWNRPWPYTAAHALVAPDATAHHATADKRAFLGRSGSGWGGMPDQANPGWLLEDEPSSHFGRFVDASSNLAADIDLAPGETRAVDFITAIHESRDSLLALLDTYADPNRAAAVLPEATQDWADRLRPTRVASDDPAFDLMNNHWLPYQAISARMWARTGYYQQSGAFGFRDQLQDSQVWLPIDPAEMRAQILLHAAHQFADGRVYHWWHPLAEFGHQTACSDDYLWLPFITATYVRDTDDTEILEARAPFVDDPAPTTLLDHCRRSLHRAFSRFSDRGLPLIGTCDWNDGLSAAGSKGKGESVWLAFFIAETLREFATLLDRIGARPEADQLRARRSKIIDAANNLAWDGHWYRRATLDDGSWIGSSQNAEGRIYLNAQTWAILSDAAPNGRAAMAWQSVRDHLLKDMGPLLLDPAYATPDPAIGYITRYSPGSRENGGVYTHAAVWALAAACKLKDTAAAERVYRAINPAIRSGANADLWASEPYATPGNIDGPLSETPGRAGWTWYTGSAAWLSRICLERVLGIRPVWDGVAIDPCPIPSLGVVDSRRLWRGRTIRLRFDAAEWAENVPPIISVNDRRRESAILTEQDAQVGGTIDVHVTWTAREVTKTRAVPTPAERSLQ